MSESQGLVNMGFDLMQSRKECDRLRNLVHEVHRIASLPGEAKAQARLAAVVAALTGEVAKGLPPRKPKEHR